MYVIILYMYVFIKDKYMIVYVYEFFKDNIFFILNRFGILIFLKDCI